MDHNCVTCKTGKPPTKQPDMTIEEIEADIRQLRSPPVMDQMEEWIASRPPAVREMARKFPHYQLYRVKENAPYRFTVAGSIVGILKFTETSEGVEPWFHVLRSPLGYAGVVAHIDPYWIEPITLDELKESVNEDR